MAKNNTNIAIPAEAMAFINRFVNSSILMREERLASFIASLYARKDNANKEVVAALQDLVVNLNETFTEEQIIDIFNNYHAIVRKCYEDLREDWINTRRDISRIPQTLVDFCIQAVGVKPYSSVFLPYAGNAEFALALPDCSSSGFESSRREWALSQIILEAYQIRNNIEHSESSIPFFYEVSSQKYDYIFTLPPTTFNKYAGYLVQSVSSILSSCLKKGGTMCIITPSSATESNQWKQFRQMLVDEHSTYSLTVISLPELLMPISEIEMTVWIIQKDYANTDKAVLVNAKDKNYCVVDSDTHRLSIKTNSILECIANYDTRVVREVPFDATGDDIRLSPERYFVDTFLPTPKNGEKLLRLRDIINTLGYLPRPAGVTSGKIVGMREMSENYLTPEIDASKLSEGNISGLIPVSGDGLLLGFIGDRFKVGVLKNVAPEEVIFLRREIIRFQIMPESGVTKDYLFRELLSEYVRKQAICLASGATIQRLSKNDILSIKILVPSIETQKQVVFSDGLAGMSAADRERIQSFEKFRKNMHMMKHGLGQTVFNLSNWMQVLNLARKEGNGILDESKELGNRIRVRIGDVFDNIEAAIKILSRQVSTFDVGYGMKVTMFSLADFIDDYIVAHPRPNVRYDFPSEKYRTDVDLTDIVIDDTDPNDVKIIEYPGESGILKGQAIDIVDFPKDALTIIVDNIVSNAVSHGFTDPKKEHIIRFAFKPEGTNYVLTISNNGAPLPDGKDPEDVFIWGHSSGGGNHTGIGGYQIRDLMEEFDGKAEIISTPTDEFTVTYRLTFTKTNIVDLQL